MTTKQTIGVAALLALLLSGCAQTAPQAAAPATAPVSLPASVPSSGPVSGPPKEPTDLIKKTGWVVGTVTTGGSGPCYGLVTDDGTEYALHNADGTQLERGTRVRVRTRTATVRIHCGAGKLVEMTAVEPVR